MTEQTIDSLIEALQAIKKEHGNLPVEVTTYWYGEEDTNVEQTTTFHADVEYRVPNQKVVVFLD